MLIHQDHCPNCRKPFCFPVQFQAEQFRTLCPHCQVGFDLLQIEASKTLEKFLSARHRASFCKRRELTRRLFRELGNLARRFRFAVPAEPDAIVFLVFRRGAPLPLAVYFQESYHLILPINRIVFALALSSVGIVLLLASGFSLLSVLMGSILASALFIWLTALPRIKGVEQERLKAEQGLLQQCYELQQTLGQIYQTRSQHQILLERQQVNLHHMLHTPSRYPTQVELYQGSIHCTQDYLSLCDQVIALHEAAIRDLVIQVENSKLSGDLPVHPEDPRRKFDLDRLKAQLVNHSPLSESKDDDPGNHHPT